MTAPGSTTHTAAELAELLDVPVSAIYSWQHRKKIVPADWISGLGRGGRRPIFFLEHVQPLAAAYKRRRHAGQTRASNG